MAHEGYHEPVELLSTQTRDMHRALISLIEELEAIDWYQQRADVCADAELKHILIHNRNEEMEHAAMTLEWIRRNESDFDSRLRQYLFREGAIEDEKEKAAQALSSGLAPSTPNASLGLGSLKGKTDGSS